MELTSRENEETKKCYTIKERLHDNLNIVYNESTSMFVFWNKYQIFIYEDFQFSEIARVFTPEFQVRQILVSNNYLVCLDLSKNVHVTSLKFKNPSQKRFKSSFQPREQGILYLEQFSSEAVLSLKWEANTYCLCLHKISPEFQLDKKVVIKHDKDQWCQQSSEKCLLRSQPITEEEYYHVKDKFLNQDQTYKDHNLILISFDKLSIYGCLFSPKTSNCEVIVTKLYTTPSEICDIKIIQTNNLDILIALTIGTVIRLALKNSLSTTLIHLNTGITKCIPLKMNDSLIYTNGKTIWKTDDSFSKDNITFHQLSVKNVKDFVKFRDQIVSTTFSKLIYILPIENEASYLKPNHDEYCSAEKFFNNIEYLIKLNQEMKKNKELIAKLHDEKNYITALSFSKRQDVMEDVIQQNVVVYDSYEEVMKEKTGTKLSEELNKYFKTNILFLVKIMINNQIQSYNQVLAEIFNNLKVHITILSNDKIIKTTSLKLTEPLKKLQVLIPIDLKDLSTRTPINVDIKIVSNIPGVRDERQKICTVLYRKQISLNSEHFIKRHLETMKSICLKEPEDTLENLILKIATIQHGDFFKFVDVATVIDPKLFSMFVKLPSNFVEAFTNEQFYKKHFSLERAKFLYKQFTSESFLKSRNYLYFEIGHEKVKIEIINEFSCPVVKIASVNVYIAFTIRDFVANLVYNEYKNYSSGKEFVNNLLYTTTENLQKALREALSSNSTTDLLSLTEAFQKDIIGALPL